MCGGKEGRAGKLCGSRLNGPIAQRWNGYKGEEAGQAPGGGRLLLTLSCQVLTVADESKLHQDKRKD